MSLVALQETANALRTAIELAEDAVKSAEAISSAKPEPIRLVKVAKAKYESVATALVKTGAFQDNSRIIEQTLQQADESFLLDMLEKLASRAVFPFDAPVESNWSLVEKPESSRGQSAAPTHLSVWQRAWQEAKDECSG